MIFMIFFSIFIFVIFIFLSVAYLTLFERHVLGLIQNRLGVNKVSFFGFFQCLFDGIKLFKKELMFPVYTYESYFFFLPIFIFVIMLLEWMILPYFYFFWSFSTNFLFFMCLVGILVYYFILIGVFSKSKFAILGSIRFSCQSVSFEILFFFFIFCFFLFIQSYFFFIFFNITMMIFFFLFIILFLVELNRAPFDFSEGESELVSGFNLELGGLFFVLLFLSEYGFMLFFCCFLTYFFFFGYFFVFILFISLFLLIRSIFPRYRYDFLMEFFWVYILPFGIIYFFFVFFYLYILMIYFTISIFCFVQKGFLFSVLF